MKPIDAGRLRTKVTVIGVTKVKNAAGYTEELTGDALGYPLYVEWRNAHGAEVLTQQELGLRDRATLRCRFDPRITPTCRIRKSRPTKPEESEQDAWEDWEIVSIDNIEDRGTGMEIQVERMEAAV